MIHLTFTTSHADQDQAGVRDIHRQVFSPAEEVRSSASSDQVNPTPDREHHPGWESIRFGLGRFNTEEEVDYVVDLVVSKVKKLRDMSPLYEMFKDGVDLKSIQWVPH